MRIEPWNVFFLAGFVAYLTIRGVFRKRAKSTEKIVSQLDAPEKILLFVVGVGNILLPVIYLFTPWLSFADYRLPEVIPWMGAVFMVGALWLFYRSHTDLGENWSVTLEVRKDHRLITQGVYRLIRHPMYAAIFLFGLAQGTLLSNWLAGWSGFATFALLYLVRVPREEEMMCEHFGENYREYMEKTGRVFPRANFRTK
jgi:protein-S-isoprenylcysteine O-methyltransferase Ste14